MLSKEEMIASGMLIEGMYHHLQQIIEQGKTIIITGEQIEASAEFLFPLCRFIPEKENILIYSHSFKLELTKRYPNREIETYITDTTKENFELNTILLQHLKKRKIGRLIYSDLKTKVDIKQFLIGSASGFKCIALMKAKDANEIIQTIKTLLQGDDTLSAKSVGQLIKEIHTIITIESVSFGYNLEKIIVTQILERCGDTMSPIYTYSKNFETHSYISNHFFRKISK